MLKLYENDLNCDGRNKKIDPEHLLADTVLILLKHYHFVSAILLEI